MRVVCDEISKYRLLPVIVMNKAQNALPLAETLIEAGLPCAEVTLRTPGALEAINMMTAKQGLLVGAGTVLSVEQAQKAWDNGAKFMVSPGLNPRVVEYCIKNKIPVFPGVSNPTDIEMALDMGLNTLKFFPAEAFGGLKTLKAIGEPYRMVDFIPTGGVNASNLGDYLSYNKVLACGGSWFVKSALIDESNFGEILRLTKEALEISKKIKR